ncbi:MAG: hypothetical protein V4676_00660, partial [Bacteroidota bacterium]
MLELVSEDWVAYRRILLLQPMEDQMAFFKIKTPQRCGVFGFLQEMKPGYAVLSVPTFLPLAF